MESPFFHTGRCHSEGIFDTNNNLDKNILLSKVLEKGIFIDQSTCGGTLKKMQQRCCVLQLRSPLTYIFNILKVGQNRRTRNLIFLLSCF